MSEASARAQAFVSAHLAQAAALGERLADLIGEPDAYLATLTDGLETLTDPVHLEMAGRVCPETPARYVIRRPLSAATSKPVKAALRESSSIYALRLAQRLAEADHRDLRMYAHDPLRRALPEDPEMSWQIMRRLGRIAEDWIATDSLADLWARGILLERFRWAELEQLLYSEHTYERRLVAATLATLPHRVPTADRDRLRPEVAAQALELVRQLMGDAETMVQKALSWALREWTPIDPVAVSALLETETSIAVQQQDGARAWVVRDSLSRQSPTAASVIRSRLAGIRRDPRASSTSIASTRAEAFAAALASSNEAVSAQGDRYTRSRA